VEKSVSKTYKSGYQICLKFIISQDVRDVTLLNSFIDYFNCGNVLTDSKGMSRFIVRKKSEIALKIIPFFVKYYLHSSKLADYNDFCKAEKIVDTKAHLNKEGLAQIDSRRSGMNRGRKH